MKTKHFLATIPVLLLSLAARAEKLTDRIILRWEVGYTKEAGVAPLLWIPAAVPGAVQLDIARAEKYKPFYYAENWKDYLWMEDQYYFYRTTFDRPDLPDGNRLHFVSLGIDYEFEIIFNTEMIFHQEGMFTPVDIDLTDRIKDKNQLLVKVFPVPKQHSSPSDRSQAAQVVKPAVSYGWDWHPRLVPLGIWDSTYLESRSLAHINDIRIDYNLNDDLSQADIDLGFAGTDLVGMQFKWVLNDASDKEVLRSEGRFEGDLLTLPLVLKKPELWWPHDHGVPYLYTWVFHLTDSTGRIVQDIKSKAGFRRVRLVMNEGAWDEPKGFPKTRSVPPMQLEINGRKIFAKGTNWVNPEIFPGIILYGGIVPIRFPHFCYKRIKSGCFSPGTRVFATCCIVWIFHLHPPVDIIKIGIVSPHLNSF